MNIKRLYDYYSFGWNYKLLFEGQVGTQNKLVVKTIDDFLKFLKEHDLKVTEKASFKDLNKIKTKLETTPPDEIISDELSGKLANAINSIDKTLDAEMQLRDAYILTEKRTNLNSLLNGVGRLFAEGIFNKLPDIVKYDFEEAGKCIAFERATAGAFHILRGTEGVLRFYSSLIYNKNESRVWGLIIDDLMKRTDIPKSLLDNLDNIRENFRNPTQHPESIYGLDDVQDLFNICSSTINSIIHDLQNKNLLK